VTKVVVLGGSGMLGSMVADVLSRASGLEVAATVRSPQALERARRILPAIDWQLFDAEAFCGGDGRFTVLARDWIVNAIGITKPLIRDDNALEVERALLVNSLFPHRLAEVAAAQGSRILQIATDCVYSGSKGAYAESDLHDALDVYGKTKSLGEVTSPAMHHLRCSIIGPEPKDFKFLLEWFRRQPRLARVNGFVNHRWNGVTTFHFAEIVRGVVSTGIALGSLQHVVPTGDRTKADMLRDFARAYDREDVQIQETSAAQVVDRTLATKHDEVNQALWRAAGRERPPTVPEMIAEVARFDFRWSE
jgi:dTDP-4-dehydrorhamnose reductase